MKTNKKLQVLYKNHLVGNLALTDDKKVAFEYTDEWLHNGFSISPFSLPLEKKVFIPSKTYFDGLFGVFADSLPDAWGNILLNRLLRKNGVNVEELTVLDRLAIVGNSGMGALTYQPDMMQENQRSDIDLDALAEQCHQILTSAYDNNLDELYTLGGTSGGARPKIMTNIDGEEWIIKFPAHVDSPEAGKMEYEYAKCAEACGIIVPETRLFPSKKCQGYFGIKRFDRIGNAPNEDRIHMCTVAALLEVDFNQPSLDYHELMKLVKILTKDNVQDVENMYRRMCFNVFGHNRDDHAKNFTYLYDDASDRWSLSPAYDITYSNTYYGEHTTAVNGNGKDPGVNDLLQVGLKAGLSRGKCRTIIEEIKNGVYSQLNQYIKKKCTFSTQKLPNSTR